MEVNLEHITLYRKYRPKNFNEVAGEVQIIKTIKAALKENRLAHAYLFCGPRGVGKTTTARLIAKGLNCDTGITDSPCGVCENCLAVNHGNFVDMIEIDAASNRGIDEIRSLKDKINYKPVRGRRKIYIIDEVHMLTKEAFNALLKTLEEPPAHVLFVLATTEPEKILDTIISRCQRFDFLPLSKEDMIGRLRFISDSEDIIIDDESLEIIFSKSGGSMRDSITILEKVASAYYLEKIDYTMTQNILGVIPREKHQEFVEVVKNSSLDKGIKFLDDIKDSGLNIEEFFKDFAFFLRNGLISKEIDIDLILGIKIIENIFETLTMFKFEEDKRLLGDIIMYKITSLSETSLSQVKEVIVERVVEKKETKVMSEDAPSKKINIDINYVKKNWNNLLQYIHKEKISMLAFVGESKPVELNGNSLVIGFDKAHKFHMEMLKKKEYAKILLDGVKETIDKNLIIEYHLLGSTKNESVHNNDENSIVDKIVEFFDGEIIN